VAVSDSMGISDFHVAVRGRSASWLAGSQGSTQTGGVRKTRQVTTVTLDSLLERLPSPDVVKLDVEGEELGALRGAKVVLSSARPIILAEVYGEHADAVADILHSHDYKLYEYKNRKRVEVQRPTYDTVAIPAGRESRTE